MDFDGLAVREGDLVTASGRLVRNETGDWFEPPLPVALPGGAHRMVRAAWRGAVRVVGASFDELHNRFEHDGAVEGFATLTGIWSRDQLRAEQQTVVDQGPHRPPTWVTPPCPAPPGSWPHLTWGHADKASKWTKAELDAVRAHLDARHEEWNLYQLGPLNTEDGQTCMSAKLTRVSPQIATWAASLPTGVLSLSPWLTAKRSSQPSDPQAVE
jgi:hypothetical protein